MERQAGDLINGVYGLTPDKVELLRARRRLACRLRERDAARVNIGWTKASECVCSGSRSPLTKLTNFQTTDRMFKACSRQIRRDRRCRTRVPHPFTTSGSR